MPEIKSTPADLQAAIVDTVIGEINGVIEGANEDIAAFANQMYADTVEAAATGRLDLLPVIEDQARVLAEKNRVRIVKGGERFVLDVLRVGLGVATKLVIPTIPTL